jgi:hypothetical protein
MTCGKCDSVSFCHCVQPDHTPNSVRQKENNYATGSDVAESELRYREMKSNLFYEGELYPNTRFILTVRYCNFRTAGVAIHDTETVYWGAKQCTKLPRLDDTMFSVHHSPYSYMVLIANTGRR